MTFGQAVPGSSCGVSAKLEKGLKVNGYDVTNAGVSGDKTLDGLARLGRSVPAGAQSSIVEGE